MYIALLLPYLLLLCLHMVMTSYLILCLELLLLHYNYLHLMPNILVFILLLFHSFLLHVFVPTINYELTIDYNSFLELNLLIRIMHSIYLIFIIFKVSKELEFDANIEDEESPQAKYTRSKANIKSGTTTVLPKVCIICERGRKRHRHLDEKLHRAETITCGMC